MLTARISVDVADPLLLPGPTAKRLGICVKTLSRWARQRRIAAVTLPSGHRRYRTSVVDAIVNGRPPGGGGDP